MINEENIDILIKNFENLKNKYKNYDTNKYKNIQNELKNFIKNHIEVIDNLTNNLDNIEYIIMNLKFLSDNENFEYIYKECESIIENMKNIDLYLINHEQILLLNI